MDAQEQSQKWQQESEPIFTFIAQWRQAHPQATMAEIEQAVDEQMQKLRAQMLQDAAHNGSGEEWAEVSSAARTCCPTCGGRLQALGQRERHLQTHGGQRVSLTRTYLAGPRYGYGFFPPDKQLGLGPSGLMPHVQQAVVHMATSLPFAEVAEHLQVFLGVQVSEATVTWQTEQAERGCVAVQDEQAEPLASCPEEEPAECMLMSGDGAFVPLVHGQWAEVKQVVIGQVEQTRTASGLTIHTTHLSSFARLTDASTFSDVLSGEVHRRGLDRVKRVCAVQDGAQWLVALVQAHRADAVRILDFAHAAGRVAAIGEAARLSGVSLPTDWLETVLHQLKQEGAGGVLLTLNELVKQMGQPEELQEHLRYLSKRTAQMDSPTFQTAGWLADWFGHDGKQQQARDASASQGSENALAARECEPMLALRMNLCNGRWQEGWGNQHRWQEQRRETKKRERCQKRLREKEQQARDRQALVAPALVVAPAQSPMVKHPKGRTEAQKRWGRQTFSPRMLRQAGSAKI